MDWPQWQVVIRTELYEVSQRALTVNADNGNWEILRSTRLPRNDMIENDSTAVRTKNHWRFCLRRVGRL